MFAIDLEKKVNFDCVKAALETRGFYVYCCASSKELCDALTACYQSRTIGVGGSLTVLSSGAAQALEKQNVLFWHWQVPADCSSEKKQAVLRSAATAEVYVSSVNALAETGEIINIDGIGNRISSLACGHEEVCLIIGRNKLCKDLQQALYRAQNIAAPKNAQRLGLQTPCAMAGNHCWNCNSPERICNGLLILQRPLGGRAYRVFLVDEDLGA